MSTLIIHHNSLTFEQTKKVERAYRKPEKVNNHCRVQLDETPSAEEIKQLADEIQVDINLLPEGFEAHK